MYQKDHKLIVLYAIIASACALLFASDPIAQNQEFHCFSDRRTILFIPNCLNVLSNIPFLFVGAIAIIYLRKKREEKNVCPLYLNYVAFFVGICLTGIGSAYYHLDPCNKTLIWDRMPMTIAFMAFFSIIIGNHISIKTGRLLLIPLLIIGISSVLYWKISEDRGAGDLRPYVLVQFLPMILIPIILLLFKNDVPRRYTFLVIIAYALAKVLEATDGGIFEYGHIISGHSLKHIIAAAAPLIFLIGLYNQKTHCSEKALGDR
jgi:hypothetical protein